MVKYGDSDLDIVALLRDLPKGYKYIVVCYTEDKDGTAELHHLCAYPEMASIMAMKELLKELKTDKELGCVGVRDLKLKCVRIEDLEKIALFFFLLVDAVCNK